jgi:transcriptional regulator with XRE-family HTH domain
MAAGYSQNAVDRITRDLGEDRHVSKSSISKYETGESVPGLNIFLSLCQLYRVNPTWVMTGVGVMEWTPGASAEADQRQLARWLHTIASYLERASDEGKDLVGVIRAEDVAQGVIEPDEMTGDDQEGTETGLLGTPGENRS